ncbi:hypothetical protein PN36_17600 [Candidatus Thiomargarita nelsonii]|uniref:Uncharacterized protein n=1 Tax=Candidatus Thiomargarita nelsonii TaxID=1003181 RepID=A0A0A6RS42_9GAMM|nr:hypothetical protein PN36_17600 [Candidatus Thiomargarita nelsonii]
MSMSNRSFEHILSNLQLELLKLYANNISENQLIEIKLLLANYFAQQATHAMDKLWETQGLTEQTMIEWTNEQNRLHKNRT